jgi:hypothetical protein
VDCDNNPLHQRLGQADFHLKLDGKVPSVEAQPVYAPSPKQFRYFAALMLDVSGSITQTNNGLKNVTESAKAFIAATLKGQTQDTIAIALYTFDGRSDARMLSDFTSSADALSTQLALIATPAACKANGFCLNSSTNLYGGFEKGLSVVNAAMANATAPIQAGALVVFTDGSEQAHLSAYANAPADVRASKLSVFTIGLAGSPDFDEMALKSLGKNGSYSTGNISELGDKFTQVGTRINDAANSYYMMRLCSPRHEGTGRLEIVATPLNGGQDGLNGAYTVTGYDETLACDANDASDDPTTTLGTAPGATPAPTPTPANTPNRWADCTWTNPSSSAVAVVSITFQVTCQIASGPYQFTITDSAAPGTTAAPGTDHFYHDFTNSPFAQSCLTPLTAMCSVQTAN